MTLKEMKIKAFSLIEEYYPDKKGLAEDEDVLNKINGIINNVQMDLMKYRKINAVEEITISEESDRIFNLKEALDNCYQIKSIDLKSYDMPNDDTLVIPDDYIGTFKIYYYKYPTLVDLTFEPDGEKTAKDVSAEYDEEFVFDLEPDILEIMVWGIAFMLLRMDMISNYGEYFRKTYEEFKNNIDPRKTSGLITIEGGVDI